MSAPLLKVFDPSHKVRLITDASDYCIGAVLEQSADEGKTWNPVEFGSKRLSQAEQNYSATEREFLAIVYSLQRWRHFIVGRPCVVLTDHAALTHLMT